MSINNAILKTLAYSDIFDFPLTIEELHRFLISSACKDEIISSLQKIDLVHMKDGYYFLRDRDEIVEIRKYHDSASQRAYMRAHQYGRILGKLPFVRMVALTGSLAMRNCDQTGDYDYMLVTSSGRVWTARIFALILNKFANIFGETLCPNLIVSERMLEWKEHNLYSAREIAQMVLIDGKGVLTDLRVANKWIQEYLPNLNIYPTSSLNERPFLPQKIGENFLRGKLGNMLESWEMKRKVRKFSNQVGFGIETNFNADVCQGNFDHHGMWTLQRYQEKLRKLDLLK